MQELSPPEFGEDFQDQFQDLLIWRRDVRRFRTDPLTDDQVQGLIDVASLSPSVGNAQPWRFISIKSPELRHGLIRNFEAANAEALQDYKGEQARLYAQLKLSGLKDAPVLLAVFSETEPEEGHGLGRKTMPETLAYSTVTAIYTLWLAARAERIGVGWVSIIDPDEIKASLDVPESWQFIALLCVGYPEEEHADPELVRHGWQVRDDKCRTIHVR
ncbi:5,6-dimethylbenzimidazole synthase [Coralliovum pocilloporae]|uniref:5,6-dimethylbenzimidazole synthase n=1 Tax=Coralliovum pocilloporae TaxID=3066369 RepID=UPI003D9C532C